MFDLSFRSSTNTQTGPWEYFNWYELNLRPHLNAAGMETSTRPLDQGSVTSTNCLYIFHCISLSYLPNGKCCQNYISNPDAGCIRVKGEWNNLLIIIYSIIREFKS